MSEPMTFQKKSRRERYIVRDDMVPVAGVEPAPCCQDWILSPARLPIPSHRRVTIITHFTRFCNIKFSLFPTLLRILCLSASFSRFFLK